MCMCMFIPHLLKSDESVIKNYLQLEELQEMRVQSLRQEDPFEKRLSTCSNIPAWRIPWTEEPGGLHTVPGIAENQTRLSTQSLSLSRLSVEGDLSLFPCLGYKYK